MSAPRGVPRPPEVRAKIAATMVGKGKTLETRAKLAYAGKERAPLMRSTLIAFWKAEHARIIKNYGLTERQEAEFRELVDKHAYTHAEALAVARLVGERVAGRPRSEVEA